MAGEPSADRDAEFRDLLLSVSKQLNETDVEELRFLGELPSCCKSLELLKAMRNKGLFSPLFCSPLAGLLKKIERHDLADEVTNKYVSLFPDQTSPPGKTEGRRRSATDPPTPLTKSTSNLDSCSLPSSLPGNALSRDLELTGDCLGSVDNVYPPTPTSATSLEAHNHNSNPRQVIRSSASAKSLSFRSVSQSSQDNPFSSCPSSSSSCIGSSYSSINHTTEAVLERASIILVNRVTANLSNYSRNIPRQQDTAPTVQSTSLALPPNLDPPPPAYLEPLRSLPVIQGPTISEIYSDQEEGGLEERRGTLECPAAIASRNRKAQQTKHQLCSSETACGLQPDQREREVDVCTTPRASVVVQEHQAELETTSGSQPLTETEGSSAECAAQPSTTASPQNQASSQPASRPPASARERNWKKCFLIFSKHRAKQSSRNSITWRVPREDLGRPIWSHDRKWCITRSHKFELDTNLGRHNPKLLFQLYPYGDSEDCGEYVTIIVRVTTSDKCPPLPASARVTISLTVRGEGESRELNRCSVEKRLDLGYFPIRRVVRHQQLKKSRSKYIYFDLEMTCGGLDAEPHSRSRLQTF